LHRRSQRGHQQAVVAPRVHAGDGARRVAAEPIGDEPLTAQCGVEVAAHGAAEADERLLAGRRRDGIPHRAIALSAATIAADGVLCTCSSSLATSAVQPVWWLAPMPAPLSPW